MRARLGSEEGLTDEQNDRIVAEARATVDAAVNFARESAYPSPEEALEKVFV